MREAFETAPRDGKVVILEDDASGTYEAARWSAEAGEWVGEDGEPIKITPTHWYDSFPFSSSRAPPQPTTAGNVVALRSVVAAAPVTLEAFEAQTAPVEANPTPHARQRFAASSITATLDRYAGRYGIFGISMMGIFGMGMMGILGISMMGGQVAEQASQLPSDSDASSFSRDIAPQQRTESDQATAQAHAQLKQAVEATAPQARQSLEKEQRPEVLAKEARAEELQQSLQQERQRAAALASELEKKIALSRKSDDEAAQREQATEARVEELQQSLQQERQRAAALASELEKKVALSRKSDERQTAEARAEELQQSLQQERQRAAALMSELSAARSELEKRIPLSRKSDDEAAQRGQAAEARAEELQQSLQQERQRATALTPDLESTQGMPEASITQERPASSLPSEMTSVTEPAAAERPVAAGAKVDPEAARLTARASILLAQGNIGAARLVLERAAEMGSAKASFALAETYDPRMLSSWGAYGTRGDAAKARKFYAKATVGGISEAKDRFNALR
jgi:hypothetical protein